jgi:hypothetical protein
MIQPNRAPGQPHSACLLDVPEPGVEMGSLLVETLAIGISDDVKVIIDFNGAA